MCNKTQCDNRRSKSTLAIVQIKYETNNWKQCEKKKKTRKMMRNKHKMSVELPTEILLKNHHGHKKNMPTLNIDDRNP